MTKPGKHFGHDRLADKLSERIKRHFQSQDEQGESLVIGIFGEWGSGKSNLLKLIEARFPQRDTTRDELPVVVVAFNPWRHEKDAHLIIPLIRTTRMAVERYQEDNGTTLNGTAVGKKLKAAGRCLGISALAFLSAFKASAEIGNDATGKFSIDISPKDAVDKAQDLLKETDGKHAALAAWLDDKADAWYFEFEQTLAGLVSGQDGFRLLFLIDDIDRCLPEKAVEMLESIKLFLDIEGCAFVLGVDDEVVERGILHRYRDYLFQKDAPDSGKALAQLPITGTEYLEKIIHLPFRLPPPTKEQIRLFLADRFKNLFGTGLARHEASNKLLRDLGMEGTADGALLDAFVAHIPPVPRKHIRVAELMGLLLELAEARGVRIEVLPLFKLTLLQLFAPELYRLCRRRTGNLKNLQDWSKREDWGQKRFHQILKEERQPHNVAGNQTKKIGNDWRSFDRVEEPLLRALEHCAENRSGFDPFLLIKNLPLDDTTLQGVAKYFSLFDEAASSDLPQDTSAGAAPAGGVKSAAARPTNLDEFMGLLFSSSPGNWQSAVQTEELQGKVLDAATFEQLLARLQGNDPKLKQADWLKTLAQVLDAQQFMTLATRAGNFNALQAPKLQEQSDDKAHEKAVAEAAFALALKPEQRAVLGRDAILRDNTLRIVTTRKLAVPQRAEAGRLLGELGDPRQGVGLGQDGLPDIDWVPIPSGVFTLGSPEGEGYEVEHPERRIEVKSFEIGRYPVTNAQFASFIKDGYNNRDYWPTAAAQAWLEGREADWSWYKGEKNLKKTYMEWLKDDQARRAPRFWDDPRWNVPNHPVVGVCWYEAQAFCAWLAEKLGRPVRLPAEDEWEYAARGQSGLRYAWGMEPDPTRGNYRDTQLGRTSAVGLFAPGEAEIAGRKPGLYDMSGNVWEWTASLWGPDNRTPMYRYGADWPTTRAERDNPDSEGFRVVRGGSWSSGAGGLRCAIRDWFHPNSRGDVLGFRAVVG